MSEAQQPSLTTYLVIYAILMVLVLVTVGVAYVDLGIYNVAVAMGIAIFKAVLVVLYFMHVKYEGYLTSIIALGSVVWLVILLGLTLSDYLTRGWLGG